MTMLFGEEHVRRYQATDGEEGHEWQGTTTLILTTKGRRSGKDRHTPLIYQQAGDNYAVVASMGGAPRHPAWFHNISDEPQVHVQVKGDRFPARARKATPEEKAELWPVMTKAWPDYDAYQERTDREIHVILLEPS
jgi:deazaflavin-dependent oxidoreductase (nitroreductase family)